MGVDIRAHPVARPLDTRADLPHVVWRAQPGPPDRRRVQPGADRVRRHVCTHRVRAACIMGVPGAIDDGNDPRCMASTGSAADGATRCRLVIGCARTTGVARRRLRHVPRRSHHGGLRLDRRWLAHLRAEGPRRACPPQRRLADDAIRNRPAKRSRRALCGE